MNLLTFIPLPTEPSFGTFFLVFILEMIILSLVWQGTKYPHYIPKTNRFFAVFLILILFLFIMNGGDYFRYKKIIENIIYTGPLFLEEGHLQIATLVNGDFLLWRLIVWGTSLFLFIKGAYRLNIDRSVFVLFLAVWISSSLSTSRGIIAFALAYYGFSIIVKPSANIKYVGSIILGILMIILSLSFHRSAVFFLLVLPFAYIFNFNRVNRYLIPILFVLLIYVINTYFVSIIEGNSFEDGKILDASSTMNEYMNQDKRAVGFSYIIWTFLQYSVYYYILYVILKNIFNGAYYLWPTYIKKFANVAVIIIIIATAFGLSSSANFYTVFYRFLAYAIYPSSIVCTYLIRDKANYKHIKRVMWLCILFFLYSNIYGAYAQLVS